MRMIELADESSDQQFAHITTYQGAMSYRILAMGFLEMADVAVRSSTAIDATTPAIMYAVRHAVELFVKHIGHDLRENHLQACSDFKVELGKHPVRPLWDKVKPTLALVLNDEAEHAAHASFDRREWIEEVENIIHEVDAIDRDGILLRFPTSKDPSTKADTPNFKGQLVVNTAQLTRFIQHVTDCFTRYTCREC